MYKTYSVFSTLDFHTYMIIYIFIYTCIYIYIYTYSVYIMHRNKHAAHTTLVMGQKFRTGRLQNGLPKKNIGIRCEEWVDLGV